MTVLKRLRRIREEQTLTQRDLAQRSGITQATIVHAEKGGEVRPSTVRRLADALCVHPRELIGEAE
jgi:transcriptional regulator with XRE-family HTH domain